MKNGMSVAKKAAMVAIGIANPEYHQLQNKTAELIAASLKLKPAERRLLNSVYKATGIEQRYSVLSDYCKSVGELDFFPNDETSIYPSTSARMKVYKENALNLALAAIHHCISQLDNFNLDQITHLITVSCTGMYAPGIDIEVVHTLGLKSSTKRTAINFMGCYGAFNALKVADTICKAEEDSTVLIVCVELCTIHFQKSMQVNNILSNAIFSDGAAAVLVQSNPKSKKFFTLENFHNDLLPQTNKEMAWHIGDHGFDIVLSTYIPEIIQTGIAAFTQNLLTSNGFLLKDIDFYAIHPGGVKILQACEAALGITLEDNRYSYEVLKKFGNMSSATILFVLKAIWEDININHNQKNIFSCAFGPGLTLESMLLKINF